MNAPGLALCVFTLAVGMPAQRSEPEASPRERHLAAWLEVRHRRDEQFAAYARYRRAFAAATQPSWLAALEPAMRTFAETVPVRCDARVVQALHADAAKRTEGDLHALLPWLLAVARQRPDDLQTHFWLVQAFGAASPVHDAQCATMHWQRVADALAVDADVRAFMPEGAQWLLPHWRTIGERLARDQPLEVDWLRRARHHERDRAFAAAMVAGHRDQLERRVRAMVHADERDAAARLLLAMVLMSRGADRRGEAERCLREYVQLRQAEPDQGERIDARLQRLGVLDACAACDLDVTTPLRWLDDAHRQRLRCAFPDFGALATVRAGLRRRIERAEEHVASGKRLWQHHHDKQQECLDKARIVDRRTRKTYWRTQASKEEGKKDVHARVIAGKRETIQRYRDQIEALERAVQRMRSFTLDG